MGSAERGAGGIMRGGSVEEGSTMAASSSPTVDRRNAARNRILLVLNCSALFVGSLTASLLSRFYFVHGGSSRWLCTWVQCAGFPLLLLPIYFSPRRRRTAFTPRFLLYCVLVGLMLGVNNFFISWGISYLPVSTSSLILSSQLAFNLVLSVVLVRQRIYFTNLNCVLLLTLSSVVLAVNSSNDKPPGVTTPQFVLGFLATLGAALMFAVYLPIMEIIYRRVFEFRAAMEMQVIMEAAATAFATVGMIAGNGFRQMKSEGSAAFDLGETKYYVVIVATVAAWQLSFMGTAGMVFLTSSLNSGICMTALLAVNVVGGVVAFGDNFGAHKAVALVLCLWGFTSYLYGEYKRTAEDGERSTEGVEKETTARVDHFPPATEPFPSGHLQLVQN